MGAGTIDGGTARTTMGFNPFSKQRKSRFDIAVVVLFLFITAIAILWAFLG